LTGIENDRDTVATLSVPQRFLRVITDMRKMKPQYRMIGEVRQPNGDSGFVFFMASLDGAVSLKDIGEVARGQGQMVQGRKQHRPTRALLRYACSRL
jgi:hypothetical protein